MQELTEITHGVESAKDERLEDGLKGSLAALKGAEKVLAPARR